MFLPSAQGPAVQRRENRDLSCPSGRHIPLNSTLHHNHDKQHSLPTYLAPHVPAFPLRLLPPLHLLDQRQTTSLHRPDPAMLHLLPHRRKLRFLPLEPARGTEVPFKRHSRHAPSRRARQRARTPLPLRRRRRPIYPLTTEHHRADHYREDRGHHTARSHPPRCPCTPGRHKLELSELDQRSVPTGPGG